MILAGELSARGAGRPLISRGRRGGIGRHGLAPREGALSALGSGRLLCGGHRPPRKSLRPTVTWIDPILSCLGPQRPTHAHGTCAWHADVCSICAG